MKQQPADDTSPAGRRKSRPASTTKIDSRSKKNPWTPEEDELLNKLVDEVGNRWRDIAEIINEHLGEKKRIGKQCRERYLNHLKRGLKTSPWTEEEDERLRQNQRIFGNKWASIAAAMDGRPENQVKNRWNAANFRKQSVARHPPTTPQPQQPPPQLPMFFSLSPAAMFPHYYATTTNLHAQQQPHLSFAPLMQALEQQQQPPPQPPLPRPAALCTLTPTASCLRLFEALPSDSELMADTRKEKTA